MARFEDLGFCPYNDIIHNNEAYWKDDITEYDKGVRTALWNLVGPFIVCRVPAAIPYTVETSKLFFGTKTLANDVLISIIKRYDFKTNAPIWISQCRKPDSSDRPVAEYIIECKNPELIFSELDAGKIVVISDGEDGELLIGFWNKS
jgi:hypothetical protein